MKKVFLIVGMAGLISLNCEAHNCDQVNAALNAQVNEWSKTLSGKNTYKWWIHTYPCVTKCINEWHKEKMYYRNWWHTCGTGFNQAMCIKKNCSSEIYDHLFPMEGCYQYPYNFCMNSCLKAPDSSGYDGCHQVCTGQCQAFKSNSKYRTS